MDASQFKEKYPEFGNLPDSLIDINLDKARVTLSAAHWKNFYNEAVGLIAAHEIYIRQSDDLAIQAKLGGIREGKGYSERFQKNYYELSSYGLRFLELRKQLPRVGFVF